MGVHLTFSCLLKTNLASSSAPSEFGRRSNDSVEKRCQRVAGRPTGPRDSSCAFSAIIEKTIMKLTFMLCMTFAASRLIAADIPAAPVQIAAAVLAAPEE